MSWKLPSGGMKERDLDCWYLGRLTDRGEIVQR
jgi:hypothetical protein